MGAALDYRTFKDGDKNQIEKNWIRLVEEDLYENGHSYSGGIGMLGKDINWKDIEAETASQAEDYLCDNHQKWDAAMGVSYLSKEGIRRWMVGGWCSE